MTRDDVCMMTFVMFEFGMKSSADGLMAIAAKSFQLLVNPFHRLGSTDEECCERTASPSRIDMR